jgi:hypothetical protein
LGLAIWILGVENGVDRQGKEGDLLGDWVVGKWGLVERGRYVKWSVDFGVKMRFILGFYFAVSV